MSNIGFFLEARKTESIFQSVRILHIYRKQRTSSFSYLGTVGKRQKRQIGFSIIKLSSTVEDKRLFIMGSLAKSRYHRILRGIAHILVYLTSFLNQPKERIFVCCIFYFIYRKHKEIYHLLLYYSVNFFLQLCCTCCFKIFSTVQLCYYDTITISIFVLHHKAKFSFHIKDSWFLFARSTSISYLLFFFL